EEFAELEVQQVPMKEQRRSELVIDNYIIDCINIYKQPVFQHPLLVSNILQHCTIDIYGEKFYGLKSTWNPKVEKENEFSHSQIIVINIENLKTICIMRIINIHNPNLECFL
ncbi:hypothetical protein Taro_047157, partial [Colocasia esculenta]|nr:hypothetical protein [Colocasia esculenta]